MEVLVSDSTSSDSTQDMTLLHMSMLMSFQESRAGRNKNKTAIYSKDKLSASATSKKWNRVKIRCVQKYNQEAQFGLRSISLFTDSHDLSLSVAGKLDRGALLSPLSSSARHSSSPATPKLSDHHQRQRLFKCPSLPSSEFQSSTTPKASEARPSKSQTPKRLYKDKSGDSVEDFEFSGVEKQSRLFHECMKGKVNDTEGSKLKGSNQILERIATEKDKYQAAPLYQRKKLLKRELPKAEVMKDFVESYKEKKSSLELSGAARRMSSHGMVQ